MQVAQVREVDAGAEQRLVKDGNSTWLVKKRGLEIKEGNLESKQNTCEMEGKRNWEAELHFL